MQAWDKHMYKTMHYIAFTLNKWYHLLSRLFFLIFFTITIHQQRHKVGSCCKERVVFSRIFVSISVTTGSDKGNSLNVTDDQKCKLYLKRIFIFIAPQNFFKFQKTILNESNLYLCGETILWNKNGRIVQFTIL